MPMDYHVCDAKQQEIHIKADQHCQDCLLMIWYDLLPEFIDIEAIISCCNRLLSCVAAAGG